MEYNVEFSEGYMGAIAWKGNNSHKRLYGADLSKAIREELKANGIKGVSVSCKHSNVLYLKFKASDADFRPFDDYLDGYSYKDLGQWFWLDGKQQHIDRFWEMDNNEDRQKALAENARRDYDYVKHSAEVYSSGYDLNEYYLDDYRVFNDDFIEKVKKAKKIVDSYNFDESNAMVDYFHRGIYDNYSVKYKPVA